MRSFNNKAQLYLYIFLTQFLFANLYAKPVNIDEMLSGKRQFRILGQFSYINLKSKNTALTTIQYQQPNGSYITIPMGVLANSNIDYLNFTMSARYGIYKRVELFSTLSAYYQHSMTSINTSFIESNRGNFNTWNLGVLVQAKNEGKYPAILLSGSIDLMNMATFSDNTSKLQYFKGYSFFATSYYTIDPLVFLLQAGFRLNLKNVNNNLSIDSGEIFTFGPSIYFAVNPYVSLNVGIKYQYKTRDFANDKVVAMQGSSVAYSLGVAYEIKQHLILFGDAEYLQTNDYVSNAINLTLSYRI